MASNTFLNREISWLYFNDRVLQEAADESTPLIERIKFLGIFSNNQDEFFRVRVATLTRMLKIKDSRNEYLDIDPNSVLDEIISMVSEQQKKFIKIYKNIITQLKHKNIFIVNEKQLNKKQQLFVQKYFREKVRSNLFPLMLKSISDNASLKDKSIYLAIALKKKDDPTKESVSIIEIPTETLSRFLILPDEGDKKFIILLDDVIRFNLETIFSIYEYDSFEAFTLKFTRDAELDLDNDISKSFLELMTESLKQRRIGAALRIVCDKNMPASMIKELSKKFNLSKKDSIEKGGRYHNFKDFTSFPNVGDSTLEYKKENPLHHIHLPENKSHFASIQKQDILFHFPYHTFTHIIDLLREASIDPKVRSIKMTLYRLATNSNVINALINAVRNGKRVTVFLELQARFDEKANIYWAGKLQEEGVRIIRGIPGFKVHCKLILIKRRQNNKLVYYANIATGNFNEESAKIYSDIGLMTCNPEITREVDQVFDLFEANYKPFKFRTLLVAPFNMRNYFYTLLSREIKNVKQGKEAWAIIKINNLVDSKLANKIIEAASFGVKIKLIIRGICVIVPGNNGIADQNIEAVSIIDKYLEHARVIAFCNGGDEKYYITSGDWMIRNFDNRIEVACPILDKNLQSQLKYFLNLQLADNTKARYLGADNINSYKTCDSALKIRSQFDFQTYLIQKHL